MGKRDVHTHSPGLLEQVVGIRSSPIPGENHLSPGGLDLGKIRGKIGIEHLMIILADDLGLGIEFL